jgi:hypothetical protein
MVAALTSFGYQSANLATDSLSKCGPHRLDAMAKAAEVSFASNGLHLARATLAANSFSNHLQATCASFDVANDETKVVAVASMPSTPLLPPGVLLPQFLPGPCEFEERPDPYTPNLCFYNVCFTYARSWQIIERRTRARRGPAGYEFCDQSRVVTRTESKRCCRMVIGGFPCGSNPCTTALPPTPAGFPPSGCLPIDPIVEINPNGNPWIPPCAF